MDQPKGENVSGPHHDYEENCLKIQLMEIMQHAVAKCPKVCISAHGIQYHLYWIPAVRLHCSGSCTLTSTYC